VLLLNRLQRHLRIGLGSAQAVASENHFGEFTLGTMAPRPGIAARSTTLFSSRNFTGHEYAMPAAGVPDVVNHPLLAAAMEEDFFDCSRHVEPSIASTFFIENLYPQRPLLRGASGPHSTRRMARSHAERISPLVPSREG